LSLAGGTDFLGYPVGKRDYRVLSLQAEVSEQHMQKRFAQQVAGYRQEASERIFNACVYSQIKFDNDTSVAMVHGWIDQYEPDLVIVDPLANFHTGDENDAQDMSRVTSALDDIRSRGVAVNLIHHHGKNSARNSNVGHKTRGSTVLPGWYDSHMSLEWVEPQKTVRLRFELRNGIAPGDMILKLNPTTLLFEPQTEEAGQIGLLIAAIRENGPSDAEGAGLHFGKTRQWASDWLNKAVEQDKLVRQEAGKKIIYSIPGQTAETTVVFSTNTGDGQTRVWRDGVEAKFGE